MKDIAVRSYGDLRMRQRATDLAVVVYGPARRLPETGLCGLTSQMQRSVVSVAATIAAAHAGETTREHLRFLEISGASPSELETPSILRARLGALSAARANLAIEAADQSGKMLGGLEQSLAEETKLRGSSAASFLQHPLGPSR